MSVKSLDENLIKGILDGDTKVIQKFYDKNFPYFRNYVKSNGGSNEEAEDIFQDGFIFVYKKLRENSLVLTSSLGTYTIGVCKGLWSNRLRKINRNDSLNASDMLLNITDEFELFEELELQEKVNLFQKSYLKLGTKCQELLRLFFQEESMKKIAERLGSSVGYIKKRKFQCKENLIKIVREDPLYKHLTDDSRNSIN